MEFEPCNEGIPTSLIPKEVTLIQNEVAAINYLFNYAAITTIATSPEMFCSEEGKRYFEEIKSIFAKHFIIPIQFDDVKAMNYFTNQYAENSFRAFNLKNTEEIGSRAY